MTNERVRAIEDWRCKGVSMAEAVRITAHLDIDIRERLAQGYDPSAGSRILAERIGS